MHIVPLWMHVLLFFSLVLLLRYPSYVAPSLLAGRVPWEPSTGRGRWPLGDENWSRAYLGSHARKGKEMVWKWERKSIDKRILIKKKRETWDHDCCMCARQFWTEGPTPAHNLLLGLFGRIKKRRIFQPLGLFNRISEKYKNKFVFHEFDLLVDCTLHWHVGR
jgi:hypothetical protein